MFAQIRTVAAFTGLAAILMLQGCGKSEEVQKAEFKASFDKSCSEGATKETAETVNKMCGCMSSKLIDGKSLADLKDLNDANSEKAKKLIADVGQQCAMAAAPAMPAVPATPAASVPAASAPAGGEAAPASAAASASEGGGPK